MKVENKFDLVLQWAATAVTILGAALTAMNVYPANVIAFNIGSVLWLLFAYRVKATSLIVVNLSMLLIYFIGAVHAAF